jgi:hypothetical protein
MSSDMFEVLDANIVVIPEEPLTQPVNPALLFEKSDLALLMRKPLTEKGFSPPQAVGFKPQRLGVVALAKSPFTYFDVIYLNRFRCR